MFYYCGNSSFSRSGLRGFLDACARFAAQPVIELTFLSPGVITRVTMPFRDAGALQNAEHE
jgi:hypothetical protein